MPRIDFIQYLRPDGRRAVVSIDRPEPVFIKAQFIRQHGFRFECETLATGQVSLTVSDDDGDYAFEIVENGPGVPEAVDRLILEFDVPKGIKQREKMQ